MKGNWSRLEIAGKAADVYEPPVPGRPRFAVVHLHGVGLETLHDKPAFTRLFEKFGLACVCPGGGKTLAQAAATRCKSPTVISSLAPVSVIRIAFDFCSGSSWP